MLASTEEIKTLSKDEKRGLWYALAVIMVFSADCLRCCCCLSTPWW